ncbi:MAG: non-hydrolyzing UDP-N-acetylglucosamine 2-epimerase [Gammaproteobacteria bacterium]
MPAFVAHLVGAARPNFMKIAPVYHALKKEPWCNVQIVHTGQHYDTNMSDAFFEDLSLPEPHFHLGVGSGTHAEQTAGVMLAYERVCLEQRPDWIVVVGDVNSTVACALVGAKLIIPVAHLEAGLRSRDRTMPEEINRIVTDAIADLLWTPSPDANENLLNEGVQPQKIERVGNIMIDSFELLRDKIERDTTRAQLAPNGSEYGVLTLHRPANVDDRGTLQALVAEIRRAARRVPLVFSVHPRTEKRLSEFGLLQDSKKNHGLRLVKPLGYIQFMNLVCGARLVVTDSGGIQEETTYLDIPCLTLRDTTERPITITQGSNRLVTAKTLVGNVEEILARRWPRSKCPELWDGQAAPRVAASLRRRLGGYHAIKQAM